MPEGVHRHPIVFVAYGETVYAIKELPRRFARIEFDVLLSIARTAQRRLPVWSNGNGSIRTASSRPPSSQPM